MRKCCEFSWLTWGIAAGGRVVFQESVEKVNGSLDPSELWCGECLHPRRLALLNFTTVRVEHLNGLRAFVGGQTLATFDGRNVGLSHTSWHGADRRGYFGNCEQNADSRSTFSVGHVSSSLYRTIWDATML